MPGLGSAELLVILAAALLFFGPRRLAGWAEAVRGKPPEPGVPGNPRGGPRESGSSHPPPPQRTGQSPREDQGDHAPSSGGATAVRMGFISDPPPEPEPTARTVPGPPPPGPPAGGPSSGDAPRPGPPDTSIKRRLLEIPKRVREDIVQAAKRPPHWSGPDWLIRAGILAGTAASSTWDEGVRDSVVAHRFDRIGFFRNYISNFGRTEGQLGVIGAFLAAGKLRDNPEWVDTGMLGLESLILTAAAVLPLKGVIGRKRPRDAQDPFDFSLFSFKNSSFPSGDTTSAVALATVIAARSKNPWVAGAAYGIAGLVAAGRVYRTRHWLSDAVGGIALGQMIGRYVIQRHHERTANAGQGESQTSLRAS
ncbi:MAG: phosphatase PAP2 family protein [Nitrospinota bacterium]|nr:phosphatase PAP2 family protein [Nitrospinota bacterium]